MRAFAVLLLLSAVCRAEVPMLWSPPQGYGPTLRDIAGRLPRDTDAREPDLITYGHEGSHFLSRFRGREHGLYAMGGRVRWVPIPPLRTAAVFDAVPEPERGTIYATYRRQGEAGPWADRPTMILDEWTAYLRGAQIRQELGIAGRQETNRHCMTMARYARTLCRMTLSVKNYERTKLVDFCRATVAECRTAIPEWDATIEFE